ncbi:MAG: pyrroline-5-carboxylate reductase [Deltaproteobacteria bacterium]|jgi:pyrroline-5-carboxylate reductase|nr:pyrroline-5-carboxylate reductase [Deltaproteobacteria bacterium]
MSLDTTIGFLGAGNMAEAIARGLIGGKLVDPDHIVGSGPRRERLDQLESKYGITTTTDNVELVKRSQVVVISVKPQILPRVIREISDELTSDKLVISVAAGIPISAIESKLRAGARVVRAMPNTPALVNAGATAIAPGEHAQPGDLDVAKTIFDAVGLTVVLDESQLDAVTGLSGSGPAYIFLILEALADAGVKVGLSRRNAQRLAAQTVMGSAKLLLDTDEHPGRLKDMVTSPGGTAIVGLHTLEEGGLRTTLINAVESATARAKELGRLAAGKDA